jgi:hypothetical protein
VLLCAACLALSASAASADWKPYKAPKDEFEVILPSEPRLKEKEQVTPDGKVRILQYLSFDQVSGAGAMVLACELPPEILKRPKDKQEEFLDSFVRVLMGGKVTMIPGVTTAGAGAGREFEGTASGGATLVRGRAFLVNGKAYVLMVLAAKDTDVKKETEKMFDSFKVK